jgi:hypothetical protein
VIESQYLFRTALSKSVLPFALYKPDLVILPVSINLSEDGIKGTKLLKANEILKEGHINASKWFQNVEKMWELLRTEKSESMSSNDRLNYQKGLTDQNLNDQFIVLYNTSGKDANSVVLDRRSLDLEFFADHKAYILSTSSKNEAFYLSAILNSSIPNKMMKDFQSRGLFGARDVHKKILDIFYPKYNEKNRVHKELAELSEQAHKKAKRYLKDNVPKQEISPLFLGKLRVEIKKYLVEEVKEIDRLMNEIIQR